MENRLDILPDELLDIVLSYLKYDTLTEKKMIDKRVYKHVEKEQRRRELLYKNMGIETFVSKVLNEVFDESQVSELFDVFHKVTSEMINTVALQSRSASDCILRLMSILGLDNLDNLDENQQIYVFLALAAWCKPILSQHFNYNFYVPRLNLFRKNNDLDDYINGMPVWFLVLNNYLKDIIRIAEITMT